MLRNKEQYCISQYTIKITNMNYKNYTIEPDNTGYAPKNMMFGIFKEEEYIESGGTVEECKKLIDEHILDNVIVTGKQIGRAHV